MKNVSNFFFLFMSCFIIILAIILLLTNILFKKKIVKSEFLLFQRYIIIIAFNIYYFVSKWESIYNIFSKSRSFKNLLFIFLLIYYVNIISVNFELYKEISCPFYNFISIFNNKWKNMFWEIFTLFFIIFGFILGKYIKDEGSTKDNFEINLQLILRINQIPLISILTLLNIISFIITIMNMTVLNNFQNKSKRQYTMKIILNFIFSIIQLGYTSIIFVGRFLPFKDIFNIICNYYLLGFFIIDMLINMTFIRNSDFYYYILGKSVISYFYCLFGCSDIYKPVIKINDSDINNEESNNGLLSSNEEVIKKDFILYYFYNDLKFRCISQFNLEVYEYFLNISIACLSSIFEKMKSSKLTNTQSDILINGYNNNKPIKMSQYCEFEFNESSFNDNEKSFITKLKINTFDKNTNYKDKFTVDIKYFYYNTFCSIIKNKNINLSDLIKSLLSHNCNFPFLICKNSKNEYFKSMKTLNLKTNDRKYTIEIFPNVLNDNSKNSILEEYLAYITSKSNTFLPILIGAFKISINNLHPFTIFISRNSIMENVPKELFNYWQLMRYLPKKEIFEKIATSKDRTSLCITEENLFTTNQKIIIKDYLNFHSILSEDVTFISNIGSKNFSLLIMYYEFDKNNPNIEEYLNMSRFNSKNSRNDSDLSNKKIIDENIEFVNSEIKKEETTSKSNLEFTIMNANKNGNGFESIFNDNKCMIFFSFEKIFEFRGYSFSKFDYNDFVRKIVDYFDSNYEE